MSATSSSGDRASILVVDDNPEKLLTLGVILSELGQDVVEARSGRDALRCLLGQEFAVILLDVNMPGMDGFETASLIRQRKNSEQTPIIFITAFSDDTHRSQGYSLGAVDYIIAPIVPEILKSKVGVFVELFRKTEQIKRQAESLEHRADQLRRLTEASLAINSALRMEEILHVVTETARNLLGTAAAVTLATVDPTRPKASSAVSLAEPGGEAIEQALAQAAAVSELLTDSGRTVRLSRRELRNGAQWAPLRSGRRMEPPKAGRLSAPLTGSDGRRLGWIHLSHRAGLEFSAEDEAIATQLGQMASIAIENKLFSEARESNRLKDEFLTVLSHELRTPLTAIVGWTRILRTSPLDEARLNRGLEIIERNVAAQAKLIEDLLDVSRIIAGKLRLSIRPMLLLPNIESAVDAMRLAAEAKQIDLELMAAPEVAAMSSLSGDPDRLQQVLWNLLANAIKFTPAGGRVEVRMERIGESVEIKVIDTGKGISPLFIGHVFDRFRQDDSTTTRSHGGLGIGLAIVQHIVELHGGRVAAASPGLNQGATFIVTLPIVPAEGELTIKADRRQDPAPPGPAELSGLRVLLVDDEPDAREVLSELLEGSGVAVTAAASMEEALQQLDRWHPDVLLSDIAMPGGDGYALIRQVRERPPEQGGTVPA
ncbi:MAG: response regulator, partial [Acidobacteriota bacterium]|nr:response regulator [Acidobacteriota bacterium]